MKEIQNNEYKLMAKLFILEKRVRYVALQLLVMLLSSLIIPFPALAISYADYPYSQPAGSYDIDAWNFYQCECTSYVAWCLNYRNGISFHNLKKPGSNESLPTTIAAQDTDGKWYYGRWGHANNWKNAAEKLGYTVDTTPAVGAVYWTWNGKISSTGHVAWVSAVNGNQVTIEQYNAGWVVIAGEYHGNHKFSSETFTAGTKGEKYIHINSTGTLDVNSVLDGVYTGGSLVKDGVTYGTFDVYVNGQLKFDDVTDIVPTNYPAGSSFEVKDIKPAKGHLYNGAEGNVVSGTIMAGQNTEVRLRFNTCINLGNDFYACIMTDFNKFFENNTSGGVINSVVSENAYSYDPKQIWHFVRATSGSIAGSYMVFSAYDGRVLDAENWGTTDGTVLQLLDGKYANDTNTAQHWYVGPDAEGMKYNLATSYGSLAVDAAGNNNRVHLWTANSANANQRFSIYKLSDMGINYAKPSAPVITSVNINANDSGHILISWGSSAGGSFDSRAYNVNIYSSNLDSPVKALNSTQKTSWEISLSPGQYAITVEAINTKYADLSSTSTRVFNVYSNYTIAYNANGGTNPPAGQTKYPGESISLSTDIPTRTGYTFLGWARSADSTSPEFQPGDTYSTDANLTLYAVWEISNPPTLTGSNFNLLMGDSHSWRDSVTLSHDGVLSYTLQASASGSAIALNGEQVTAKAVGTGTITVKVVEYPAASCTLSVNVVDLSTMLKLPAALTAIEAEAFENSGIIAVTVPSKCVSIGNKAFADNHGLVYAYIPKSVTNIAADAFVGCPNLIIYCYNDTDAYYYAKSKNIKYQLLSDEWVLANEVPLGATITNEKWTYKKTVTETRTSTETSLSGWTRGDYTWEKTKDGSYDFAVFPDGFDTGHTLYSKYAVPSVPAETKRELESTAQKSYIYWHWCFIDACAASDTDHNVLVEDARRTHVNISGSVYRDFIYFDAFESTTNYGTVGPGKNGDIDVDPMRYAWRGVLDDASQWWWRFEIQSQSYTDYHKLYSYSRTVTTEESSSAAVVEGNGISNVQHWVKYSY